MLTLYRGLPLMDYEGNCIYLKEGLHKVSSFKVNNSIIESCYIEVVKTNNPKFTKISRYGLQPHLMMDL